MAGSRVRERSLRRRKASDALIPTSAAVKGTDGPAATTAPFAGTLVTTAPSTYRQSALDMSAPGTMGYLDELLVQAGGALTA